MFVICPLQLHKNNKEIYSDFARFHYSFQYINTIFSTNTSIFYNNHIDTYFLDVLLIDIALDFY